MRAACQLGLVAAGQRRRLAAIRAGLAQVAGEAQALEARGVDGAAAVLVPELVVDAAVGLEAAGRIGEALGPEGGPERGPLRPPEVEQGVVEVEENGAEGQGYLAR
jgi:hypothetical protein